MLLIIYSLMFELLLFITALVDASTVLGVVLTGGGVLSESLLFSANVYISLLTI